MSNNNNNWKRIGGYSRTGTQNYVRTSDAAMGGTTFGGSTDVSYNTGNTTHRIGNNAGVIFVNGDIDMTGGAGIAAPINRVRNVRDPVENQDVATKYYVDKTVLSITKQLDVSMGPTGPVGPPGIGLSGDNGSDGSTGPTGVTGARGPKGDTEGVIGPTGANGARGATGVNGVAGSTGPIGPVGSKGEQGLQGIQGIQGTSGTLLWLNPDGDSVTNELIIDSYLLSKTPLQTTMKTVGPIAVSATYGNQNKIIPVSRFWNTALDITKLAVIPSGVWVLNLYASVPTNSDANQVSLHAAIFMISGTSNQPSPDSLIIETKDGGDSGYYPPRAAYLPDHIKYVGRSWEITNPPVNTENKIDTTTGKEVNSTAKRLYKLEMPVDFVTLKDASGNSENIYLQLQIYIKNTLRANQTANVLLYYQNNPNTTETTYSYLQTTFGAIGVDGPPGSTGTKGDVGSQGNQGDTGPRGATGAGGPTGPLGPRGERGFQGERGPQGPAGQSNSFGPQYSVQYRSNPAINDTDPSGSFAGTNNFRYAANGSTTNISDASMGTVIINDLACRSIHSSFYIEDASILSSTRPRTFIKGGEVGGSYVVLASGKNTSNGGPTSSPATINDITNGIKIINKLDENPPIATLNLHNNNDKVTSKVGMKFDLASGNVITADDKFCIVYASGAVGIGGMTPIEMTATEQSGLNRMLHVSGNVMVGTNPGSNPIVAQSAMIMLNQATSAPTTTTYPGLYHRIATGATASAIGIQDSSGGLGITAPNFITFQTGTTPTQNNSIVINSAGNVSLFGRTNLNSRVTIGKPYEDTSTHATVQSMVDISGITHVSSAATTFTDNPRIKLISNAINPSLSIPGFSESANEIRGVNNANTSGFLRLTAQTAEKSCIDLIGENSSNAIYNNSVRFGTAGTERMIINSSGNIGIGTSAPTSSARVDIAGGNLSMTNNKIINVLNPTNNQDVATKKYVDDVVSSGTNDISTTTGLTNALSSGIMANNPTIADAGASVTNQRIIFTTASSARATLMNDAELLYNPSSNTLFVNGKIGVGTTTALNSNASLDVTGNAIMRNSVAIGSSNIPSAPLDVTGNAKITGNLSMEGTGKIIGLVNPTALQDAATKKYVDDVVSSATNDISTTTGLTNALSSGIMANNPTIADAGASVTNQRIIFTTASSARATLMNDAELSYNPSSNTLFVNGKIGVGTTTALNSNASLDVTGNAIMRNSVAIGSSNIPSTPLDVTGNAKITGNLSMEGTGKIIGLVNPTALQDAATKKYVDDAVSSATNDISTTTGLTNALSSGIMANNPTIADAGASVTNQRIIFTTASSARATLMNDAELSYNPSSNTLFVNGKIGVGTTTALNSNASLDVTGNAIMRNSVAIGSSNIPSTPLDVTGNAKITGNLSMEGTGKIIGLVNPTALQDAATKKYVDDIISYSGSGSLFPTVERADNDNNTHYLTFIPSGDLSTTNGNSKRALLRSDVNGPTYNPSTNMLSASQLDLNGNAILRSSVSIGSSNAPSTSLDVTGGAKITGNLSMEGTGKIIGLVNPSSNQDAATKKYVDDSIVAGTTNTASTTYVNTAINEANVWFRMGYGTRGVSQRQRSLSGQNTIIQAPRFDSDYRRPIRIMYIMHFMTGSNFGNSNTNANYSIYLRFWNPPIANSLPYYSQAVDKTGNVYGPYSNTEDVGFYLFNTSAIPHPPNPSTGFKRIVHGEITFWANGQMSNNSAIDIHNNTIRMSHECHQFGQASFFGYFKGWGQLNNLTYDAYTGNGNNVDFEFYTPDAAHLATDGQNPGILVEYYIHKT